MKRMESAGEILRRPAAGTILRTIRIHDHVTQSSQEIQILQATRKNQIVAKCFGRSSRPHGWDWFMRHLRQRMVIRWLEL